MVSLRTSRRKVPWEHRLKGGSIFTRRSPQSQTRQLKAALLLPSGPPQSPSEKSNNTRRVASGPHWDPTVTLTCLRVSCSLQSLKSSKLPNDRFLLNVEYKKKWTWKNISLWMHIGTSVTSQKYLLQNYLSYCRVTVQIQQNMARKNCKTRSFLSKLQCWYFLNGFYVSNKGLCSKCCNTMSIGGVRTLCGLS